MHFHLVVVLSMIWPHLIRAENANIQDGVAFDQVATASENVEESARKSEEMQKEFREQLISSMIDTVHYENSNGFLPMDMVVSPSPIPSAPLDEPKATSSSMETSNFTSTNSLNQRDNSSTIDSVQGEAIENDPAYSTEAKMFLNLPNLNTNRRSFEYRDSANDFDLLKVGNNTPIVAKYPDFRDDSIDSSDSDDESVHDRPWSSFRHKSREEMQSYGMIAPVRSHEGSTYDYYSSYDTEVRKSKENGKVAGNHHLSRETPLRYENGATASTSPGTGEETNVRSASNAKTNDDSYGSVPLTSQPTQNHRFSRPVVVAETNSKYNSPSRIADPDADDYQTSRIIDAASSQVSQRYTMNNRDGKLRGADDSRDVSDDSDYVEYRERPRRVQKGRRRPSESPKRLPKEHQSSLDAGMDDSTEYEWQGKRQHSSRSKPHRQRTAGQQSWTSDEDTRQDQYDSYEETRYDGRSSGSEARNAKSHRKSKLRPSSSWNHVSPNLEISHSSGIEIGQLEKPKMIVPVKVNLLPLANFDHATAIGNSQGFDVSNVALRNIVSATPVNPITTPTTVINAAGAAVGHETATKLRVSTPIPDVIVGQNSFQNSIRAMYPQLNEQPKFLSNWRAQYVPSTASSIYAVTPAFDSTLQGLSSQDVQATAIPRPTYVAASNQASTNHLPQLVVPQPTLQTVPTFVQTPIASSDYIQVSSHGMHGQNTISYGGLHAQPVSTMPTIAPAAQTVPLTKFNLLTLESQKKKALLPASNTAFLASASLAVGQNDQRQTLNGDSYYLQNSNPEEMAKPQMQGGLYQQVLKNVNVAPKPKAYIQTTHLLPAVLHPVPTLTTISATTPQMFPEQQAVLQPTNLFHQPARNQAQRYTDIQNGVSPMKNDRYPSLTYQTIDTMASYHAANASPGASGIVENPHLPHVGTRNVEILNPNIKPSPVDTTIINSYEAMHYPAAVLTTSIPMFATTSFVSARPATLSPATGSANGEIPAGSLDSTEIGTKSNQPFVGDSKAYHSHDRPMYNPIHFVPNMDVVKNQNALNSKIHAAEPLQPSLNLVPLIPGGNFFRPSFSAQTDLLAKPKLASDLESYAEQMFKESLKTIYNSQKWNNDRKNATDTSDIVKLKNELQRLKASLSDPKWSKENKELIEGHHSEAKPQTAELPNKKPDKLLAALEQVLKNHPLESSHKLSGNGKPHRYRRPGHSDKANFAPHSDTRDTKYIRDFLPPAQPNSHRSKGHFHDKPGKKRPGPFRYHSHGHYHGPRPYPRNSLSPKVGGPETSPSNIGPHQIDSFSQPEDEHDSRQFGKGPSFESYPPFIASPSFDKTTFPKNHQPLENKENLYNNPKMHNLLGWLMKSKQLPNGGSPSYFQGTAQLKQFFEDQQQRMQQQFYDDTLKQYLSNMSENVLHSNLGQTVSDDRRSFPEKRTI